MRLSVIPTSPIPAYRQLYDEILSQVISGELRPGDALPPIRLAAKELGISVITVRTAWEALEADGLIVTRSGSGCFIADLSADELHEKRKTMLNEPLSRLLEAAGKLGFSKEELIELIEKTY
jgi:GntR family transcriptional regulator